MGIGRGRIRLAQQVVAALPAEYRHQELQAHHPAGNDQDDEREPEDRQVEGRQVLELNTVLGRQAVAQEAQREEAAEARGEGGGGTLRAQVLRASRVAVKR